MTRKAALLTEAITYFTLAFASMGFLSGEFPRSVGGDPTLSLGGVLLWFLLTYGLRSLLGFVLDEYPRIPAQSVGCLLAAVALLLPLSWGWGALFLCALGNALFSTGAGGESLSFARGHFIRPAAVFSAGISGSALGIFHAEASFVLALLLIALSATTFFFSETRKYPRRIRSFRHSTHASFPRWAVLSLGLFVALACVLSSVLVRNADFQGGSDFIPGLFCALGCLAGGIAADRFGPRKAAVVSLLLALPLLTVFTHIPWLFCLGLAALNAPLSVILGASTAALPSHPRFLCGLVSVTVLLGSIPSLFPFSVTASVRVIAGILLLLAAGAAYLLYTDHCKFFNFLSLRGKKGGAR